MMRKLIGNYRKNIFLTVRHEMQYFVNDARYHKIRNLKNNTTSTNWCPSFPDIRAAHLRQFVERIEAPYSWRPFNCHACVAHFLIFDSQLVVVPIYRLCL